MTHDVIATSPEQEELLKKASLLSLRSLHDAATKLANLKHTPTMLSAHSLFSLFMCQATRNRRSTVPFVRIHLRVASQTGSVPVKIRLGATNI
ncbi:hypothetical protein [Bartonella sp. A05]|uniref:hypothetical protein n=1 Tax=Bartonella sp. A05 TaxID=2967261 RepID=UPI0022A902C6|nr:hypothetical protein [Bartonella sp. A05]MCZ2204162.1 hypothetical protein [Bartonella sp. A05]